MQKERLVACVARRRRFPFRSLQRHRGNPNSGLWPKSTRCRMERPYVSHQYEEFNVEYPDGITEEEARDTLVLDVGQGIEDAQKLAGDAWDGLSELRQEILSNLAFNMGHYRFSKFRGVWRNLAKGDIGIDGFRNGGLIMGQTDLNVELAVYFSPMLTTMPDSWSYRNVRFSNP